MTVVTVVGIQDDVSGAEVRVGDRIVRVAHRPELGAQILAARGDRQS